MGKSTDNVVEFPATSAKPATEETPQAMTPEEAQAKAQQGQEFLLKMIEKKRHEGVEILSRKVDNLENGGELAQDAAVEARLRDLQKGLGGSLTSLEAINSLLDYFRHDLFQVIKNLTRLEQVQFQSGAHLQTLLRLLEKKEIISEQEMQETWNEMVPQEAQVANETTETTEEAATSESEADPE